MARNLEDIFNECYERIRAGESLQSCLARYPEHYAELKSLLETTFDIGRRASYIHPRPEFKHWAQVRLQGAQHQSNQQMQGENPSPFSGGRQSWAVAVAAVLIMLLTTGGTMAASSNAMPDQTLYPMKLATEEMQVAFAFSEESKAEIHTQLAETRATEIGVMANKGKTEHVAITAARLAKQMELADAAIAKMESAALSTPTPTPTPEPAPTPTPEPAPTPPTSTQQEKDRSARCERYKKSLDDSTSKTLWALENAKEKASPQNKSDLQKSIDKIKEQRKERVQDWKDGYKDK